jgi:DNA-binding transcriptional ArsR family regulator
MENIFKALAHRSRRALLDSLFERDGQTLGELCHGAGFTRQAVSKHLRILTDSGLIVTHWEGREKLHYLNPAPIQEISERWIRKFSRRRLTAVSALKEALEENHDE